MIEIEEKNEKEQTKEYGPRKDPPCKEHLQIFQHVRNLQAKKYSPFFSATNKPFLKANPVCRHLNFEYISRTTFHKKFNEQKL